MGLSGLAKASVHGAIELHAKVSVQVWPLLASENEETVPVKAPDAYRVPMRTLPAP